MVGPSPIFFKLGLVSSGINAAFCSVWIPSFICTCLGPFLMSLVYDSNFVYPMQRRISRTGLLKSFPEDILLYLVYRDVSFCAEGGRPHSKFA